MPTNPIPVFTPASPAPAAAASVFTPPSSLRGIIVSGAWNGAGNGEFPRDGIQSGKPYYWVGLHAVFWINSGGGYWYFSPAGANAKGMKSFSNVATPDLATDWVRLDNGAELPGFSVTSAAPPTAVISAPSSTPPSAPSVFTRPVISPTAPPVILPSA